MPRDQSVVVRMMDGEIGGMQEQTRGGHQPHGIGIERVTEDGVAYRGQMESDLVGTAGDGFDLHPGPVCEAGKHTPAGLGWPTRLRIDAIPWRPPRVAGDREIDQPLVIHGQSRHEALVSLADGTRLKLPAEVSLGLGIEGHQHQAGCVAIEPMNDDGPWKSRLHTTGQAVLQVRSTAWHCEQARWLVEDDQSEVTMNDPAGIHIRHHSG